MGVTIKTAIPTYVLRWLGYFQHDNSKFDIPASIPGKAVKVRDGLFATHIFLNDCDVEHLVTVRIASHLLQQGDVLLYADLDRASNGAPTGMGFVLVAATSDGERFETIIAEAIAAEEPRRLARAEFERARQSLQQVAALDHLQWPCEMTDSERLHHNDGEPAAHDDPTLPQLEW
jgi:hypothetical protein